MSNLTCKKRIEAEINADKDRKGLYKLMGNAVYSKTMENVWNRIDVQLVRKEKNYLKWTSKTSHMPRKIFHNDLVAISYIKITLTIKNPAYIEVCILDVSKVLMYAFHYDYIK